MSRLFNPLPADDRSTEEQLRDLGVEVIKKNTGAVTGVKWAKRYAASNRGAPAINVGDKNIYVNAAATKMLNPRGKRYDIGTGDYQGQRVMLIRESARGYKLTIAVNKGCVYAISSTLGLLQQLADAGITGRYNLIAIKGGWLGVPE
jgi:hypothetical protein